MLALVVQGIFIAIIQRELGSAFQYLIVAASILLLPTLNNPNQERKPNQMTKILIAYIVGLVVGAGATLCIVEQLLK